MSWWKTIREQPKLVLMISVFVALIILYFALDVVTWKGNQDHHTIMETTSAILTSFIGLTTLNRYYSHKNNTLLFIGSGFIGASILEFNNVLLTSQIFSSTFPTSLARLTGWSWLSVQLFLAILLWLSWLVWYRGDNDKISERRIYVVVTLLTLGSMVFFRTVSLPRVSYPSFPIINRPGELSAALFYSMAFIGYYRKGNWRHDWFEYSLVLALIVGLVNQSLFIASARQSFDTAFNIAHVLKILGYSLVLMGSFYSMNALFNQAEQSTRELARANLELVRSHADLVRSQQIAHIGNWEMDLHTKHFVGSSEMYRIFDVDETVKTLELEDVISFIHPDDRMAFKSLQYTTPDNIHRVTPFVDCRIIRKNGETRHIHFENEVVSDESNKPLKLIGIAQDITDRVKSQERKLALMLEKERIDILTSFITQAAHEFKTPLSIINMHAYILKRAVETPENQVKLDEIENQVKNINTLIDALITMSKLDGSTQKPPMVELNINDILNMIYTRTESIAEAKGIHTKLKLAPHPIKVQGNISYLEQAISHIMNNALEWSSQDDIVTLQTETNDGEAIITIHDTGEGISEENMPHIFKRFYRADEAGTARGFGLGLPIASSIVKLHNGKITVESIKGEGATFTIILPRL